MRGFEPRTSSTRTKHATRLRYTPIFARIAEIIQENRLTDKSELDAEHPTTLTDRIRQVSGSLLNGLGAWLHRLGVHPDLITVLGLVLVAVAAVIIALGWLQIGGVILLVAFPFDALDGAVARAMERKDRVGAVLDSTLDRYADGLIFGALAYYFADRHELNYMLLALAALIGSFTVSYVRARAGEADLSVKVGLLTRLERVIVVLVALLIPPLLLPGLVVLAVGTQVSVVQRLWYVYQHLDREV